MEVSIHKIMIPALVALGFAACLLAPPARAARVEDVVAACDRMDAAKPGSCRYVVTDKGLGGCTRVGCFYCPADGSRDCYAMRTSGKAQQVDVDKIQMKCNRGAEGWCK